ncbi:helix-turn-helix domain-containing protein [Paenibacillus lutimineralis]|uniref:XRE family transcriptional regulator n=1 Tax=Paenibacillus lutimineralis TaxID=2707005 RepID=A0A3Q9I933_9BACL|nr:helix-turn-helix transcriptional regulator [Paenibacillus lutimineralis]AZS15321.1 XRE family transcriptional regulator [Paenibacillus lutimineralis]
MELFERIRVVRQSKGITQTFVATETGLTISNYNMKENGKRTISANELELIAKALGVPVGIFFEENIHEKLNIESTLSSTRKEVG